MKEHVSRSVSSRRDEEQPSTYNNQQTRQERRERKALRLKRAILKTLKRQWPSMAMLIALTLLSAQPSYAQAAFTDFARKLEELFTGPVVRTIAIVAIVLLGVGAALGRITAEQAASVIVGIILMLSAVQIVVWIGS